jgi:hypothetical protein
MWHWGKSAIILGYGGSGVEEYTGMEYIFDPLTAVDAVGHEFTHGVVDYTAALSPYGESGALDESFADIFGAAIEHFVEGPSDDVWTIGEDNTIKYQGNPFVRSLKDPNVSRDPDTYLGDYWYSGPVNRIYIHTNCCVQNHWYYLLSEGGHGRNDNGDEFNVLGLGVEKAAKIAYRNLAFYLNSYSGYIDARAGAIQAAIDIYGRHEEAIATAHAWYAVGVGGQDDYSCAEYADFYLRDCAGDIGNTPSPCPRYWEFETEHLTLNHTCEGDKWLPGCRNRIRTTVRNRGIDTEAGHPELNKARLFAYWTEAGLGLTWPPPAQHPEDLASRRINNGDDQFIDISVLPGKAWPVDWYWDAPSDAEIASFADHVCIGFAINPTGPVGSPEAEEPPSTWHDRLTASMVPCDNNNIAQINLITDRESRCSKGEGDPASFEYTFRVRNDGDEDMWVLAEADIVPWAPGWYETHYPEGWFYVEPHGGIRVHLTVVAPSDAEHLDSCLLHLSAFKSYDEVTAEPHGGITIDMTIDDYPPESSSLVLEALCPDYDPDCCPLWIPPEICLSMGKKVPLQWTVPDVDILSLPEKIWYFLLCRDTVPTVELAKGHAHVESVAVDFDLSVPKFQWVETPVDFTQLGWDSTYYYRVYAVDEAGNISGGSNVVGTRLVRYVIGDLNFDWWIDIDDIVFLASYIFSFGAEPRPYWIGDVDCSSQIDIDDVVYLTNYVFNEGPPPCEPGLPSTPMPARAGSGDVSLTLVTDDKDGGGGMKVSMESAIPVQGLQLEFRAVGEIFDASATCLLDGIESFCGFADDILMVGAVDIEGQSIIPSDNRAVLDIVYSGSGELELSDFAVVGDGGGRLNATASEVRGEKVVPQQHALHQNYPNPFNPVTDISFCLPAASHVTLEIFNIMGQRVSTLLDEKMDVGVHTVQWEGRNSNGREVASGVYFYNLRSGDFRETKKMLLLR